MNERRLLIRIGRGEVANVSFADLSKLAEGLGFELRRVSGSHHIFSHPEIAQLVNPISSGTSEALPSSPDSEAHRALRSSSEGRLMSDYHINVFYSDEDAAYVADVPDLEACSAFGSSPEEALAEVERAKQAWLDAARTAGKPIPKPRYRPAIYTPGA
jgi:predicted RNase H-like HicB family nuclease/predicted RNA binding protein YcfA (HicA-like mRNA interferase family)